MARKARVDGRGARHHVTSHLISELGRLDNLEMDLFQNAVAQAALRFPIRVHAFCIMRTHIHLALECEKPCLSAFMKLALQLCAQRLNKRRKRRGPVFDRRFFNQVVERDAHWLHLVAYIHLNPVHTLDQRPTIHRWSSARAYATPSTTLDWLVTEEYITAFGSRGRLNAYVEMVRQSRFRGQAPTPPQSTRRLFTSPSVRDDPQWPPDFRRPNRLRRLEETLQ